MFKEPQLDLQENREEKFNARETVNGHEIVCTFYPDVSSQMYEMHFPQIDFGSEEATEKGVSDQNIRISEDEDEAKFVFNKTKKWAEEENDIHDLYNRVNKLVQTL